MQQAAEVGSWVDLQPYVRKVQVLVLTESLFNSYFVTTVKEGKEMLIGSSDASSTSRN